ncbi:MAG TPA: DUF2845 domain-containing protein [Luteibacter sp.]|jgi:hypothetical protein|uniref:DUF2845 domain-containing protein n=1 Tax=Luteibacter sp. TaxID=1886636 RepID=UPI002F3E8426
MKRVIVGLLLAALAIPAIASETWRVNSQVVSTGDSEGRLRQIAGKPDRETPIETSRGGLRGYRLEYFQQTKSVQVEIINGRVSDIKQIEN